MKIHKNADMNSLHIRKFCEVKEDSDRLLEIAMEKLGLSARAHSRILKIARLLRTLKEEQI